MKTGLVLEGGGTRGIYTAGILDIFLENGIEFDGVIGVSAGAIHGCSFVSKQKGRSLRYYKNYCKDPRFMSMRSLIKTGDFVGAKFCYHELPDELDIYDHDAFKASKTKFYVTCTNIETGEPEYILMKDMKKQIGYLRASASLPYFSRIVGLRGKKYLDGGCSDSVPVEAFQKMGYEKNVIILTRPKDYVKKPEFGKLASIAYKKYPKFVETLTNRHNEYNECMKKIEGMEMDGSVLVIRPEESLNIGRLENDPEKMQEIYDKGYADGQKYLSMVTEFLRAN